MSPGPARAEKMLAEIDAALGGGDPVATVLTAGDSLASAFPVSDLAQASLAAAGTALVRVVAAAGAETGEVAVDRDLAGAWFATSVRPADGSPLPGLWDPLAGDYQTSDGWIRLHTNAAHHREAALCVVGCPPERERVADAVRSWSATALEAAVVAAGGAAAEMRSVDEWREHPVGRAVASEPLVAVTRPEGGSPGRASPRGSVLGVDPGAPLRGLRVLDLTRIIAGPVATRTLAGWGAEVLRIDPPGWSEGHALADLMPGKRAAFLDLRSAAGRRIFIELLAGADILVHGLRGDALERLGLGTETRYAINPDLIDVSLNAYGWTGPWRHRRGFDSLVQMSSGIAAAGALWADTAAPTPLPVQALDHATGYLLAAAALAGLRLRMQEGSASTWRLSLARTAALLLSSEESEPGSAPSPGVDVWGRPELALEATDWGAMQRLPSPVTVGGRPWRWSAPARALGLDPPVW